MPLARLPIRAESAREHADPRFRAIFDQATVGLAYTDLCGRFLEANRKLCELLGYTADELRTLTTSQLAHPDERDQQERLNSELLSGKHDSYTTEDRYFRKDGELLWIRRTVTLLDRSADNEPGLVQVFEYAAERRELEERFRATFDHASVGIMHSSLDRTILAVNRKFCDMVGYTSEELQLGSVRRVHHPDDSDADQSLEKQLVAGKIDSFAFEKRYIRKDGSVFWANRTVSMVRDDMGRPKYFIRVIEDISARKEAEKRLLYVAQHDALTDLPNRTLIREHLTAALGRSARNDRRLAVLFVDLDGFKLANDSHGHEAGDTLLKVAAKRLLTQLRQGDMVGRLAGDEFVLICEDIDDPGTISQLAQRIQETLRHTVAFRDTHLVVTASIGIAIGHGSTHSVDGLLASADTAMYEIKSRGGDGWQFFSEDLHAQAHQRIAITNGLRVAIERNELYPRFQPIVAAQSGQIVGAELLLRWRSPEGEVPPAAFIPIAEATRSILPIGRWVFREGCLAQVAWQQRWRDQAPYVSVNVSARQLSNETLVADFAAILEATGADPDRIHLEVTETALMADIDTGSRVLDDLARLGLHIAIDDFGTGYSSLAQLTRLPVGVLKIDPTFVAGIEEHREGRTVVRAIISLGRALGLRLVAEGVETAHQLVELQACGCDFVQGYYFHRPLDELSFISVVDGGLADKGLSPVRLTCTTGGTPGQADTRKQARPAEARRLTDG
jgi:diguanylate cyclase (GGDEF)-like protein/PAS domain S-box-containing protein